MTVTIGLLGATGKVGQGAAEVLLAASGCRIVLGGRDAENRYRPFRELGQSIQCMEVDVFDEEALLAFCAECDIVVNCAGPAKIILDRVALAALRQSAHYVDAAGDEQLYRQLKKHLPEMAAKGLTFIVSAGIYPGLSEMLPVYAAQAYFDEVERLELFFAGSGEFSLNAAYDIVCSIGEDAGHGMACCLDGQAHRINGSSRQTYTFTAPAGKRDAYPVLSFEFLEMARRNGLGYACFYNTYSDMSVLGKFMTIKALQQYKTEEQKIASARLLAEQYAAGADADGGYAQFELLAEGTREGRRLALMGQLLYRGDWNRLSGIVAAHAALLVLKDGGAVPGCYLASEGVDPAKMIEALRRHNAGFTCSVSETGARQG
ncbi:saccharopine dehydrogenase NADP-binding domain-containing protein [Paenibacillus sp. HN-1]|uniref:saccharopine dehydrogenase family protein n=1 Tax=Paenibacillus TaxID=44249 RepID=UPI001CA8B6B0|nr:MULTISPECIES: saccharopine dehydrogenase NADP-binding domain-containing protein [Paenibacillus]MBY9080395.1 saccharopine dehydrogenase NADP-binding domain-containing protein [Paenibacillus sp. CGMCC 1.18879]MBY9083975.1 saccharopine dehydrogenase NADP-binding domain-containing protein [Paenibacillus sinensis]